MTGNIGFHPAGPEDAPRLNRTLTALSAELGDTHRASDDDLARALSTPHPSAQGMLAQSGETTAGAALYTPVFSTIYGPGVYVTDLWIAPAYRGARLGPRLLTAVLRDAGEKWDAQRLTLNVYHDNTAAQRFYQRLGFATAKSYSAMVLEAPGCNELKGLR